MIIAFCVASVLSGVISPKLHMTTASLLAMCGALLGVASAFTMETTKRHTFRQTHTLQHRADFWRDVYLKTQREERHDSSTAAAAAGPSEIRPHKD